MKIYKCLAQRISISESYEFIQAPSLSVAMDKNWLAVEAEKGNMFENADFVDSYKVIKACEVKNLGQVPTQWHNSLPYHHPNYVPCGSNKRTLKEIIMPSETDDAMSVNDAINLLLRKQRIISVEIDKLKKIKIK